MAVPPAHKTNQTLSLSSLLSKLSLARESPQLSFPTPPKIYFLVSTICFIITICQGVILELWEQAELFPCC